MDTETRQRVAVGRIVAAHGIRGEVVVVPSCDVPTVFAAGSTLWAASPGRPGVDLTVDGGRPHRGGLLLCFRGISDRTAAEGLRQAVLYTEPGRLPPAEPDECYHFEVVDRPVVDSEGRELGEVRAIVEGGGNTLLEVAGPRGIFLIPFVAAYVVGLDRATGVVRVRDVDDLIALGRE